MTTDFRALCGEILQLLDYYIPEDGRPTCWDTWRQRARAAMAEAAPESGKPASVAKEPRPTDQQLKTFACEWWHKFGFVKNKATCTWVIDEIAPEHFVDFMRSVLARWGNPAPQHNPWKDTLLDALVCNFLLNAENEDDPRKALNDLIAWEKQLATDPLINPAPQPVLVSERLPGPDDCDAEGRCWWGEPQIGDSHDATWNLCTQDEAEEYCTWGTKYGWLPAHALPLPTTND